MVSREFQERMDSLLDDFCATRMLSGLRLILPHWPMYTGFTDEVAPLAVALKTLRVQHRAELSAAQMEAVVYLQHATEDALEGQRGS